MASTNTAERTLAKLHRKLITYGELVMFSHTIFSLPFAMIAMMLAAEGMPDYRIFIWLLVALFAGRNAANALNRYVDQYYDGKNPRTKGRHIPSGSVKASEALMLTALGYVVFVFAAYQINVVCFILSPFALVLFTLNSFTKRFTWLCHMILGATCAGAPVGAWVAVTGDLAFTPLVIAAVVALWVGGFDIIYGTQDIEFDKAIGLHSVPAQFGFRGAIWIARGMHFVMWLLLASLPFYTVLSWPFSVGVILSAILLIFEHYMVEPEHRKKMNWAAYHVNQVISTLLLVTATVDIFWL